MVQDFLCQEFMLTQTMVLETKEKHPNFYQFVHLGIKTKKNSTVENIVKHHLNLLTSTVLHQLPQRARTYWFYADSVSYLAESYSLP